MSTLLSNDVLPQTLRDAGLPEADLELLIGDLTDGQYEALRSLLCEQLLKESELGHVRISDPVTHQPAVFHSILSGGKSDSKKNQVVAFSFSNVARKGMWAIFGLLYTVFTGDLSPASVPGAANAISAFWGSLSVLRLPQDADVIAVIRAIGLIKGELRAKKLDGSPTNQQIEAKSGLSSAAVAAALKQLETRHIIRNVRWGAQTGDYSHSANEWTVRL
jgi:hypothetical protein